MVRKLLLLLGMLALAVFLAPRPALAASFTVNTTSDAVDDNLLDGVCHTTLPGGGCSLRAAVMQANATAGPDQIILGADTYNLTLPGDDPAETSMPMVGQSLQVAPYGGTSVGDLDVYDSLTIIGNAGDVNGNPANTVIKAQNSQKIFSVNPVWDREVNFTLQALTITGGNNTYPYSNFGPGNEGYAGALDWGGFGSGALTIDNCVITGNTATDGDAGGLYLYQVKGQSSHITISRSTISNNSAPRTGGASGGGIWASNADITIRDSIISGNSASNGGGFYLADGDSKPIKITNTAFRNNHADRGIGGALLSRFSATLQIENSEFSGNTARDYGGGLVLGAPATFTYSLTNVTVSGNSVTNNTTSANGGGMWLDGGGAINMVNLTVTGNSAPVSGGGIYASSSQAAVVISLYNSIITGNSGGDTYGPIDNQANNLTSVTGFTTTLADNGGTTALAYNGGYVKTHAISSISNARDAGDNNKNSLTTDQRGYARKYGTIDVGAFEFQPAPTTTALSASSTTFTYGTSVTFTATLSPSTATGTVTFSGGGIPAGATVALSSGQAQYTTSVIGAGNQTITATYGGDTNNSGSSGTLSVTVSKASTTTGLTSSVNPSNYNQSVTFTATVSGVAGGATPTGTVTFKDGPTTLTDVTLLNGTATLTTSILSPGVTHAITAVYSGDGNYNVSTSAPVNQEVRKIPTALVITSSVNPSVTGQNPTVTARFTTGAGPTGTVTFWEGTTNLGSPTISSGNAMQLLSGLSAGDHNITATYPGDAVYATSTSPAFTQTANKADTATVLGLSPNPALLGSTVRATATVSVLSPGAGAPTGQIIFNVDGVDKPPVSLTGTSAYVDLSGLTQGNHSVLARYAGDAGFNTSSSATQTLSVTKAATQTALTASAATSGYSGAVTFTAAVTSPTIGGVPTGTVTFKDGLTTLGTGTLNGSGEAALTLDNLAVGNHSITAFYGSDSLYDTSTSAAAALRVDPGTIVVTLALGTFTSEYGLPVSYTATMGAVPVDVTAPTGTVTFKDGSVVLGTDALTGDTASVSSDGALAGDRSITAEYAGDANWAAATSAGVILHVQQAGLTADITASPASSTYGGTVTFTASLARTTPGSGAPTGTVRFVDADTGATIATSGAISAWQASADIAALGAGVHHIQAVYNGDANFAGASSTSMAYTVAKADPTVSVTSGTNPSTLGQLVTFTATVSSGATTPTGSVIFYDGGAALGPAVSLNGSGIATLSVATLAVGDHSMTAAYQGDANFLSKTSAAITQRVDKGVVTVTLDKNAASVPYRETVTLTATVAGAPGTGTPTGQVSFMDGATERALVDLDPSGTAVFSTTLLAAGPHSFTAVYLGDANFATRTSAATSVDVAPATTATTVSPSPAAPKYGEMVTFTATVTAPVAGGTPTGTVTFLDGGATLGTGTLDGSGHAAYTTTAPLAVGDHTISARYEGEGSYAASTSASQTLTVARAVTVTALTVDHATTSYGEGVAFTATVTAPVAGGTPVGPISFYDGAALLGSTTLAGGQAVLSIPAGLSVGAHTVTAEYGGGNVYAGSTSAAVAQTVSQTATTASVSAGGSSKYGEAVTFTATVTPQVASPVKPTGTVRFLEGAAELGTGTLDATLHATWTAPTGLAMGAHDVTAVYVGDTNYLGSTSDPFTQTVARAITTASVTAGGTSKYGEPVTFTATVTPATAGALAATGTVHFMEGATELGTDTLDATLHAAWTAPKGLAIGAHDVTVVYDGDTRYLGSTSGAFTQTVGKAVTAAAVTTSGTSKYGESITFTATVTPASAGAVKATGTVHFMEGATELGTDTLNASLQAAWTAPKGLTVGAHDVTVVYDGDDNYLASTSDPFRQTVAQAVTTASVTAGGTSKYGESITFTATVTPASTGALDPTGTVRFLDGATQVGTGTLDATLHATWTAPKGLTTGAHDVTAVYVGDTNYLTSTSTAFRQTVAQAVTTTAVTAGGTSKYGEPITFTATVTPATTGALDPTGTVRFLDGATEVGTGTLDATLHATWTPPHGLAVGPHDVTAVYVGDTNYLTSTAAAFRQTVAKAVTAASVTAGGASKYGESVTFTATVTPATAGALDPTGTVRFMEGGAELGRGTLDATLHATWTAPIGLAVGPHDVTAVYDGDDNYLGKTSDPFTQTVSEAITSTSVSTGGTSRYGESVTFTATVTPATTGALQPTGTVHFMKGAAELGTGTLDATRHATWTAPGGLTVGAHDVTAVYDGDTNYLTSTSAVYRQTVLKAITAAAVTASGTSKYGEAITFTATVTPATAGAVKATGPVHFMEGATELGAGTLDATLHATWTAPAGLTLGAHQLTVVYDGDSNYLGQASDPYTQTVEKAVTAAAVTASGTSKYGEAITFTATVTPATAGAVKATGTVHFMDGATELGTDTLDASLHAVWTEPLGLSVGDHSVTVIYDGDANYLGKTSDPFNQAVAQATTTAAVTASGSSKYGEAVTFTATVTRATTGDHVATGTVHFMEGATELGTGTLDAATGRTAAWTAPIGLPMGAHDVTAVYAGDTNYLGSTSDPFTQTVEKATTAAVLTASSDTRYGEPAAFKVKVTPASTGASKPTGTVHFMEGAAELGTGTLDADTGLTTWTAPIGLTVGAHTVTAVYDGDTNYQGKTADPFTQTVAKAITVATVTASGTSKYGEPITFTATVTPASTGAQKATGPVHFMEGMTELGTGTLDGTLHATWTAPLGLTMGAHEVNVVYDGDGNYLGTPSEPFTQTVEKAITAATVSASGTSRYGESITFTATVTPATAGALAPTGRVRFMEGATELGSGTLDAALNATWTAPIGLPVGAHNVTAVYDGDGNYQGKTSDPFTQTVEKAITAATVTASGTGRYGESITFTATVTPASTGTNKPTGTVRFMDGATELGTGHLDQLSGISQWTEPIGLAVGAHHVIAVYEGDGNYLTKTSDPFTQTVEKATTAVSLTASGSSKYGEPITFTATVTPATTGALDPTGTVRFMEGATELGTGTLDATLHATWTALIGLTVGAHDVTAVFDGDGNYLDKTSDPFTQTVDRTTTAISLTASGSSKYGESITFTATVTPATTGALDPTGTVHFMEGVTELGTGTLDGTGHATWTAPLGLTMGAHDVTAVYDGDGNYLGKTSDPFTQTVAKAVTAVGVSASGASRYGESITFTATVTPATAGAVTATGTVHFMEGSTELGTAALDATLHAVWQAASGLPVGAHAVTAIYDGDANYAGSTAAAFTQTVEKAITAVTVTASGSSKYGEAINFTATVAPATAGTVTATGTVHFIDGATELGTGTLDATLQATWTEPIGLSVAAHAVTVVYDGDANYLGKTSATFTQTVTEAVTGTSLAASGAAGTVTFTASVTPLSMGASPPTGTVRITEGATELGTGTLNGAGQATWIAPAGLTEHPHSLTAAYVGDGNYLSSSSAAFVISDTTPTLAAIADQRTEVGRSVRVDLTGADADSDTLTYAATGLPPALRIDPATGVISGYLTNTANAQSPYTVTVTVTDNTPGGLGGDAASQTFTWEVLGDMTAPTWPASATLTASAITETSLQLAWTGATDNIGVTQYRVYRGSDLLGSVNGTSYAVTGLTRNTSYTFRVEAADAAGNRTGGPSVTAVTALGTPALSVTPDSGTLVPGSTITVSFTGQAGASATYTLSYQRSTDGINFVSGQALSGSFSAGSGAQPLFTASIAVGGSGEYWRGLQLLVTFTDVNHTTTTASRSLGVQVAPPPEPVTISVSAPVALTRESTVQLSGSASPGAAVSVSRNGVTQGAFTVGDTGTFTYSAALVEGENQFVLTATRRGLSATAGTSVTRDSTPPALQVTADHPTPAAADAKLLITTEPGAAAQLDGTSVSLGADGTARVNVKLEVGPNTFVVTATDKAGNTARTETTIERTRPTCDLTDIADNWAAAEICGLVESKIVTGFEDNTFRPEASVNRTQFMVMLARALGIEPDTAGGSTFADQNQIPDWAQGYVSALAAAGLVKGDAEGSFRPDAEISRAELAILAARVLAFRQSGTTGGNSSFADQDQIPTWAADALQTAVSNGLMTGFPDGTFRAGASATRAQAAVLIARLMALVNG